MSRIESPNNNDVISTLVKGIEIELTLKTLGQILNIPYKGVPLDKVKMSDKFLLANEILLPGKGLPLESNKLRPIPRLIG